jgi:hypothetical protein
MDVLTIAERLPSNSHNALCDEDGYYWPRGLYVLDVTDDLARPWYDADNIPTPSMYSKMLYHADEPSRFYQVLGYEETIIFLPDTAAGRYLEPGRYCPRCDMDKSACGCRDEFD